MDCSHLIDHFTVKQLNSWLLSGKQICINKVTLSEPSPGGREGEKRLWKESESNC